ncbi:MAG TPA: DedA family protein [Lacipirellulaceae bacterium]|jgi:membrane protein DedA with SNARE-associated domain|nr:DedA family protein [Lacipirellulaceae bacterium]
MLGSLLHPSSYLGFFIFIAATGCGLPIPEEAAIVVAGVLSAQGQLGNVWVAFTACLAGAIVGDSFMYAIGYRWGHRLFTSHPRFAKLLATENEAQFHAELQRHALKIMLIARFLIGIRAPVYVMTGAVRMPYRRFIVYDVISASFVVGTVFWLAYMFGANVQEWIHHTEFIATLIVLAVVAIVGGVLYYLNRQTVLEFIFGGETSSAEHRPTASSQEKT